METWLILAFDETEVQTAGSLHYDDDLRSVYKYDSRVHNHRQVAVGDIVVVRSRDALVGVATIARIESQAGTKHVFRCPACRSTYIKSRLVKRPQFKCQKCRHEFDSPQKEIIPCTLFAAHFGDSFVDAADAISVDALRSACQNYNGFLSMQRLDVEAIIHEVAIHAPQAMKFFTEGSLHLSDDEGEVEYMPSGKDRRAMVFRQIRARRGQQAFRRGLVDRHGARCMISGCHTLAVLEAAHISPFRGDDDNNLSNGLLLRSDLHTLFDLNLIGINPLTLEVSIHSSLIQSEYELLRGTALDIKQAVSGAALSERWSAYCSTDAATAIEEMGTEESRS